MKYSSFFDFLQPPKNVKTILSSWAIQKQVMGQFGLWVIFCQLPLKTIVLYMCWWLFIA